MKERKFIGIDLGGTKCAVLLGDESGVIQRDCFATGAEMLPEEALEKMLAQIGEVLTKQKMDKSDVCALGISCGGPLDRGKGVILSPPNLPLWDGIAITDFFRSRLGVPAYLQNDANACALAEWRYGAGKGCKNVVFLTFGTGLGAGLILDGRLFEGANGMAGELGYIRLAPEGPVGYGKAGSFEGFCSGGGLRQLAQMRLGEDLTARDLVLRADEGDERAQAVLCESARKLGEGLAVVVNLLNPEVIVIGSVFARGERWFRGEMERVLAEEALPQSLSVCRVVPSVLGDALGDVAALAVARNGLEADNKIGHY